MRIALFVILMAIPANVGCAALPMDGSLIKKAVSKEQSGPSIKAVAEGESCRCEAVCH